jgi:transcriptional regulator with XRE-family HTH domain
MIHNVAAELPIGTKIKRRRQVLRWTQEDLAGRLGVSKSTVANWESGKHFPLRYLGAVELELGINLTESADPDSLERLAEDVASSRDLTDRQKRALLDLIQRRNGQAG